MAKKKKTSKNDNEYNFDVFNDYKCDGQYVMVIDGTEITIKEEQTVDCNTDT